MLKQRLITGVLVALAMLAAVLWLPTVALAAVMLVFVLIGGWEWAALTGISQHSSRLVFVALLAFGALVAWLSTQPQQLVVIAIGCVWWSVVLVLLAVYHPHTPVGVAQQAGLRVAGLITLIPAWVALIDLHQVRADLLIFLLFLVAIADSAAYFTGKAFGKTQLAPELSPGKTREGVFGALLGTGLFAAAGALWFQLPIILAVYFIGLSLVTALISVVGDLFESLLKRRAGVKDSGTLLPGHGGVLDRIDSISAAAPVFALGFHWMAWPQKLSG